MLAPSLALALLACSGSGGVDVTGDSSPAVDDTSSADDTAPPDDTSPSDDTAHHGSGAPIAILMIGDGMGPGQLEAASLYGHGATGALQLQALEHAGSLSTASFSGITDSAAAGTTMATGRKTLNGRIGMDRDGAELETLVELARRLGKSAGAVTTSSVTHATPAAFTAHEESRNNYNDIADDQAAAPPQVLMGGGARNFLASDEPGSARDDEGLIETLEAAGCEVARDADAMAASEAGCLVGLFADEHLDYVIERPDDTTQPTLAEMSMKAISLLDRDEQGFFLVIEGARIDMASHSNNLEGTVTEALAFDEAVAQVAGWAAGRDEVLLLVTADHECGGLQVVTGKGAGELPEVTWRWGSHTNAEIGIFGQGPGSELFDGARLDHTWVHAALAAHLEERDVETPRVDLVPDGILSEHRHRAAEQTQATDFGGGWNQLDALTIDADAWGLALGVQGLFEWQQNALVLLIDVDYGAGTGAAGLAGALSDEDGLFDAVLSAAPLEDPGVAGFGAEVAVGSWGAYETDVDDLIAEAGARGITPELGAPDDLWWLPVASNFSHATRIYDGPGAAVTDEGYEALIPWAALYPELGGGVPEGAEIAVAAALVGDGGALLSNQALPPFAAGAHDADGAPLPGLVTFAIDADEDGVGDGASAPQVVTP